MKTYIDDIIILMRDKEHLSIVFQSLQVTGLTLAILKSSIWDTHLP